jgi:predicted dehydrogenase
VLGKIFSADTEDEVYATLRYPAGVSAQLSVNWSDESFRKMTTRVTIWGTKGRISVDRQECQVYLRDTATPPEGYEHGWNIRYTTDLTPPVWFYVRGEEYSAELDYFVRSVKGALGDGESPGLNSFGSAAVTDQVIEMLIADATSPSTGAAERQAPAPRRTRGRLADLRERLTREAGRRLGRGDRRSSGERSAA